MSWANLIRLDHFNLKNTIRIHTCRPTWSRHPFQTATPSSWPVVPCSDPGTSMRRLKRSWRSLKVRFKTNFRSPMSTEHLCFLDWRKLLPPKTKVLELRMPLKWLVRGVELRLETQEGRIKTIGCPNLKILSSVTVTLHEIIIGTWTVTRTLLTRWNSGMLLSLKSLRQRKQRPITTQSSAPHSRSAPMYR